MSRDIGKASHNLRFAVRVLRLHEKNDSIYTPHYDQEECSLELSVTLGRIAESCFSVETSALHSLNYLVPLA